MKISKEQLKTFWYEDEVGNRIEWPDDRVDAPENAAYYITRFPKMLITQYNRLIRQIDVDKCRHPRRHIKSTYGWVDGIVGRECELCHGTQIKKKWHFWPKKWEAHGSRPAFSFNTTWNDEKIILAMANSGDFTLSEAIIVYASACERCMNVLAHKYSNGVDGYAEYSEEWQKCNTECQFCRGE